MVASLLKIVSTGMQDERLQPPKGQPDLGSFLTVMVKAGRYATNWTRIDFDTAPDFGKSSVIRLPTKGEMIGRIYLVTQMPDIATIQRKAYYTRKPIRLANSNYTQLRLFEIESYVQKKNMSFPKFSRPPTYPSPDYGLANFSGYQLDDLNVDGTYTLTLSLPPDTAATSAVTTFLLTDVALKNPQFTQLNTDTFLVASLQSTGIGDIIVFMHSYNGTLWQKSPALTGLQDGSMNSLAYNGSQYIGLGNYRPNFKSIIIENTTETLVQPGFSACRRIAYNGSQYVSVGLAEAPPGSISYSTDGLSWVPAFNPPGLTVDHYGTGGNSVAWIPAIGNRKWVAVGKWGDTSYPSGIITTSTNGITWTTPSYIPIIQGPYVKGPIAQQLFIANKDAFAGWYLTTGELSTINSIDTDIVSIASNITTIQTHLETPNISDLNTARENFLTALSLSTIVSSLTQYSILLNTSSQTLNVLTQGYTNVAIASQEFLNTFNNIPPYNLAAPYAVIALFIATSNDTTTSLNTIVSNIQALRSRITELLSKYALFNSSSQELCTAISTAIAADPTGTSLVWPIESDNTTWYPVKLKLDAASSNTTNLTAYSSETLAFYNDEVFARIQNIEYTIGSYYSIRSGNMIFLVDSTQSPPITSGKATCIAINGSQIVIGGQFYQFSVYADQLFYTGSLIYSPDGGNTWSFPTDPTGGSGGSVDPVANDVAWTGSVWVAGGRWVNSSISFSSDGFTWLAAINPLNTAAGSVYTIALSPTDLVIGGLWDLNDGTRGSLTKASGTSLDYKWGTIIRPTQLDTNTVSVYGISYKPTGGPYILVGQWTDSAGALFGNISLSTDGITWQEPVIPVDPSRAYSTAYAAATNGSKWVVVGYWRSTKSGEGNTIAYSGNLSPQNFSQWSFSDTLRNGYGQNIIFHSGKFIVVGSWPDGYITVSTDDGGTLFNTPAFLTGTTTGTGYSISHTGSENTYILGGSFLIDASAANESLANISINSSTGAVTLNEFTTPQGVDTAQVQLASGVAWNGLNGDLSVYIAVGIWVLTDSTYATLCYSNDGLIWQQPFNPPGISQSSANLATSVSWNGTQFVAMGFWNGLTISTSIDGQTWTVPVNPPEVLGTQSLGTAATWNGSSWIVAGNWFNALGTSVGNVTSFTYGINFSKPVNPIGAVSGAAVTVVWNPNTQKWLAGSGAFNRRGGPWADNIDRSLPTTTSGILSSSTDGLNWTTPTNLKGVELLNPFSQIAVINSRVYIIGGIYYTTQPLMSSTDGINWSIQPFTDAKFGSGNGIAWNGSAWTAVGIFQIRDWGIIKNAPIIISTDGQTWSDPIFPIIAISPLIQEILNLPAAKLGVNYTAALNSVAWNGQMWVAVGQIKLVVGDPNGETQQYSIGQIVSCSDINNLVWTMNPIRALETINNYTSLNESVGNAVAWNGQLWVAVGLFGAIVKYITTSTDGINWSDPIAPANVSTGTATGVAWNGHVWIVVGSWQDVEGNQYNIIRSTDGQTWSSAINAIPSTNYYLSTITWNGSRFVAGGLDSSSNGVIMVSPDGITWTYANPSSGTITEIISKRIQPFTRPQPPDPTMTVFSQAQTNGYTLSWIRDRNYGTGSQVLTTLTPGQPFTYTFRAAKRTQWLTVGTYYSPPSIIDISLNLLTPAVGSFQTDLVGPHFGWTNNLGHSLIDSASITIGGNLVETINGQLMEVLDEFQTPLEKVNEKSRQLCRAETGFTQKTFGYSGTAGQTTTTHLPFWFSRGDPGCVLPIDALNVDEVRLTVNFKPITSLYYTDSRNALPAINVEGGSLWPMVNSKFYYEDTSGTVLPNLEPFRSYIEPTLAFPDIQMPATYSIQDSHLMVEYIYLDKAEANRFRIADLQVPIVQHYTLNPEDTNKNTFAKIRLDIPNPTRDLFFYCQRYEAPSLNAHFLATRDLSKNQTNPYSLWWPDASGLDARFYGTLRPGFSDSGSEPIRWLALNYSETLNRYSTENVALFRSLLPSIEQRKAPWINRYYYNLPFGCQNGLNPISMPLGNANLDKVQRISLALGFHGITGDPTDSYTERFWVRTFAETYNIFRVYGGRGTMMFAY
jgi:hypothetical protein